MFEAEFHFHKWQINLWRQKWRLAATNTESEGNFFFSGVAPFTTFPLNMGSGISVTLVTEQDNTSTNTSFLHLELTHFKCMHPTDANTTCKHSTCHSYWSLGCFCPKLQTRRGNCTPNLSNRPGQQLRSNIQSDVTENWESTLSFYLKEGRSILTLLLSKM